MQQRLVRNERLRRAGNRSQSNRRKLQRKLARIGRRDNKWLAHISHW